MCVGFVVAVTSTLPVDMCHVLTFVGVFFFCFCFFSAYNDLVVPLMKSCPQALKTPNSAGVTPEDLLNWTKQEQEVLSQNTVSVLFSRKFQLLTASKCHLNVLLFARKDNLI